MVEIKKLSWVHILSAILLVATFFLPWVVWDGAAVKGSSMPAGEFFKLAKEKAGIENPLQSLTFIFYFFFLIPVMAIWSITLLFRNKFSIWAALIAGILSLSLVIVYYLFTKNISENGLIKAYSFSPWFYVHVFSALLLLLTAGSSKWLLKTGIIIITVLATYFGFKEVSGRLEKDILSEEHKTTDQIKTDYSITASNLIKEFITSDTGANKKYREKILEVRGIANTVEVAADSTSTIKFADSTGSYAIFSLEKSQMDKVNKIKAGDSVSVKGVCSGSIFSEILGTTSISFKRSTIYNKY